MCNKSAPNLTAQTAMVYFSNWEDFLKRIKEQIVPVLLAMKSLLQEFGTITVKAKQLQIDCT